MGRSLESKNTDEFAISRDDRDLRGRIMSTITATKNEHSVKSVETGGVQEFPAPIGRLLGLKLTDVSMGRATIEFEATERHANPMGTLHGGVLCDIADAAMGFAYYTTLAADESLTTLELKINFLRPVSKATLRAKAKVVRAGRFVGFVECDVVDEQERLVARASSTCMTLRGRLAEGRQLKRDQLDELRFGQPTENREREWERRGSQFLPGQIDADERFPGYLREPYLPRFESRRARNFAKQRVPEGDTLYVLHSSPPSQTNADQFPGTTESDDENTDATSASRATC
jgi:uncharacterized protein (TIGR00369 family)